MNWLAILVAAIAEYVLGMLWYGPVFGKMWMKFTGMTKKDMEKNKSKMPVLYAGGFVVAFVVALVIELLFGTFAITTMTGALMTAFWFWLGFIATFSFNPVLWQDQPIGLWVLNNGYNLLSLLIMAAILVAW